SCQIEQWDAARGDVLAHLSPRDVKPLAAQSIMQFGMNEMDLAQIGLRGVLADARAMLDRLPAVGVALYAETCEQADVGLIGFAKSVGIAAADGGDGADWELGFAIHSSSRYNCL